MAGYIIPAQYQTIEIRVANSRFIAAIKPAFNIAQARSFLSEIKSTYPDASHHVPAFVIGQGSSEISHTSDDGEPSGTAGRPALSVLQGSGLGDAALVITRYFGGTKLGTGGLVKAYSAAARKVISAVPKAKRVLAHSGRLVTPYSLYEQMHRLISSHQGLITEEEFTEQVTLSVTLPSDRLIQFENQLQELSSGSIAMNIKEGEHLIIIPLSD